MDAIIYGMYDPREGVVRYVGKTTYTLEKRLKEHTKQSARWPSYLGEWLRGLIDDGITPEIVLLEAVDSSNVDAAERRWIEHLTSEGVPLVNTTYCQPHAERAIGQEANAERLERWREWLGKGRSLDRDPDMEISADDIITFRRRHGLSQKKFAKLIGRSHSAVSLWESGKRRPPVYGKRMLARLEEMLSTTED